MGVCSVPTVVRMTTTLMAQVSGATTWSALTTVLEAVTAAGRPNGFYTTVATSDGLMVASGLSAFAGLTLQEGLTWAGVTTVTGAEWLSALTTAADAASVGGQYVNNWASVTFAPGFTKSSYVRRVTAYNGTEYLVFASFDQWAWEAAQPCTAAYDAPCSSVNVNRVLGQTASMLGVSVTTSAFNSVLSDVTSSSSYRVQATAGDAPFYAFVFTTAGVCAAHGGNSANVGKTVTEILTSAGIDTISGAVREGVLCVRVC